MIKLCLPVYEQLCPPVIAGQYEAIYNQSRYDKWPLAILKHCQLLQLGISLILCLCFSVLFSFMGSVLIQIN